MWITHAELPHRGLDNSSVVIHTLHNPAGFFRDIFYTLNGGDQDGGREQAGLVKSSVPGVYFTRLPPRHASLLNASGNKLNSEKNRVQYLKNIRLDARGSRRSF